MEVTLIALVIVVVAVAVDAIGRFDERHEPVEAGPITRDKIVVDLSGRDRD